MRAIQALEAGGPEVLALVDVAVPEPSPTQVLVKVSAAGVNFIDIYRRSGLYPMPFPHIVGSEGAGVVTEVGSEVDTFAVGDHVAWSQAPGSYAEFVAVEADQALPVPANIDADTAAALPLQGMTAHYLVRSTYPVQAGETVLLHAGAGGVGLLLTQLATARGARVITTVSTAEKEALSREAGAVDVIRYDQLDDLTEQLPPLVREAAGGGVAAVFDGVGQATFDASLACLRRRGMLVLYGGASGPVPPVDLQRLNAGGSLFTTRPKLDDYIASRDELVWRADELFAAVSDGSLHVRIGERYPLAEAADAHRALKARQTTGKVVLDVA